MLEPDGSRTLPSGPLRHSAICIACIVAPIVCLGVELLLRIGRDLGTDPLPSPGHIVLVLEVPLATVLLLRREARGNSTPRRLEGWLGGVALCTTLLYTLQFVPLVPIGLVFVPVGLGLLVFAPLGALLALTSLALRLVRSSPRRGMRDLIAGFAVGVLILSLLDLRAVLTVAHVQSFEHDRADVTSASWVREHGDRKTLLELARFGKVPLTRPCSWLWLRFESVSAEFVRRLWPSFTGEERPSSWDS